MKLFNIFCIITLVGFSFSSCEQYEVIQPETEIATQDLSSARMVAAIVVDSDGGHDMEEGETIGKDGGNDNTAEICLVDVSSANPNGTDGENTRKLTIRP